jgi:hypothetical protein
VLEAAVDDAAKDLGLEEEVAEAGRVDRHVVALDLALLGGEIPLIHGENRSKHFKITMAATSTKARWDNPIVM